MLRPRCVAAGEGKGRTVSLHPQEALLQQAHELQRSDGFTKYGRRRVVVEHRLARLVQLGMRQAPYFGRAKMLFQLLMAATVANLTLVAGMVGVMGDGVSENRSLFSALALVTYQRSGAVPLAPVGLDLRLSQPGPHRHIPFQDHALNLIRPYATLPTRRHR